jgi:hypothetical protein
MIRQRNRPKLSLVAMPKPVQAHDYATASEEIEGLLRQLPGIVAIYRTGGVSAPGISDLDRIAVVEGHEPVPVVWHELSDRSRYLAMHTPFLVDQATFRRHRWFAYIEPLELSVGSAVELEDRPSPELSEVLMGAESLMSCLFRLVKQVLTGRLKVRQFLCELHNLRHGLRLARLDPADVPSAWQLVEDVSHLRTTWFSSSQSLNTELVTDLADRALPALLEALWILGERSDSVNDDAARAIKPGAPWSNVRLVPSDSMPSLVHGVRPIGFPLSRSARTAELRWRGMHPRIPLHPGALALLAGTSPQHREFRAARDEIVGSYRRFLDTHGDGYSGIGLAIPFLK